VDGYIAGPNEDLSFLKMVEKEGEDYGYTASDCAKTSVSSFTTFPNNTQKQAHVFIYF
jgi:hypothetical protein